MARSIYRSLRVGLKYYRRRPFYPRKQERILNDDLPLPVMIPRESGYIFVKSHLKKSYAARRMLREFYGFRTERDLKRVYKRITSKGVSHRSDNHLRFLDLLERRLDIFCFKVGFFVSFLQARDGIRRGLVNINNRTMKRYNYKLHDGDFLSLNFRKGFTYKMVCNRVLERARLAIQENEETIATNEDKESTVKKLYLNHVPPRHIPLRHFDINYTTLTVHYRRGISGPQDIIDFGSTFGPHNDIFKVVQYYWYSYLCKKK